MAARTSHSLRALVLALLAVSSAATYDLPDVLGNVSAADGARFDLKDSTGRGMDCVHIIPGSTADQYRAAYHSLVGDEYQVRLATSKDLLQWTFHSTIISNADMPFVAAIGGGRGRFLLAHEQWMNPGSKIPSRLGFKVYDSLDDLLDHSEWAEVVRSLEAPTALHRSRAPAPTQADPCAAR